MSNCVESIAYTDHSESSALGLWRIVCMLWTVYYHLVLRDPVHERCGGGSGHPYTISQTLDSCLGTVTENRAHETHCRANSFPQTVHLKGLSRVWLLVWRIRCSCLLKVASQMSHFLSVPCFDPAGLAAAMPDI